MSTQKTHTAQQFSPWSLIRTVWKGRWIILATWLVVSAVGAVVVHLLPTIYTAQALVLVDSQKIPERFVSSTVSTDLQDRIASISQQILSSTQLNKIINDFGLYKKERATMVQEEIIDKMRKDIEIKVDRGGGFAKNKPGAFRVVYQGPNPSVVAQVANRITELFINENLQTRTVQAEGTAEFIESQLEEAKRQLDSLEAAVSDYKLKHNGELPQQENALGGTLGRYQGELMSTRDAISRGADTRLLQESALSTAEATLQAVQEQAAMPVPTPGGQVQMGTPGRTVSDGGVTRVVMPARRSDTLRAQLEAARVRWKENHPEVKRLKADLEQAEQAEQAQDASAAAVAAAAKAALAARAPEPPKPVETVAQNAAPVVPVPLPPTSLRESPQVMQLRERTQTLRTEIELTKRDVEKRKANEQRLLASIADLQARIDKLPLREQEMAVLMRDYGISKENYQRLLANKLSAGMSKDMELRQKSERFMVLDNATVPERPSKPNRPVLTAGASGFGAFLGILIAFLLEFRRDVLLGDWELPAEVLILGTLPQLSNFAPAGAAKSGRGKPFFRKRAVVSSAVVGVLAVAAVGFYLVRNRF